MNFELRPEKPEDYKEVEALTREAFWNHFSPGCDEHYLAHILRGEPGFVPELDYVALDGDKIIGNIMYMKSIIIGDDGNKYDVLGIGPLSVLPDYQRMGVGRELLRETGKLAHDLGYRAVFLFGDPAYYSKQGFIPAEKFKIRTSDNMYAAAHQVLLFYEGALDGLSGRYIEDPVYEFDKNQSEEFDKNFPHKEKVTGTPSQKRFDEIVVLRKPAE